MLSLHMITWYDPDAPMKIWWSRPNHNDLPIWIPSQLLISSRGRSDGHTNFQNIINSLSSTRNVLLDVSSKLNCLYNLVLESLDFFPLLDSFLCPRSIWNQDFVKIIGRNCLLNAKFCLRIHGMKSPWSSSLLDQFEREFGLDYIFYPVSLSFNF